jgi:GH43 family beta-xylosidase
MGVNRFVAASFALMSLGSSHAAAPLNPLVRGDFPDPSVAKIDGRYWMTTTSTEWSPSFPLLVSDDLAAWRQVGAVFAKPPAWAARNFWAPKIAEVGKRTLVYYTARRRSDERLVVAVASADRPEGPYTDHGPIVAQKVGSIDAFPFLDDDGQRWLFWKEDGNSTQGDSAVLWVQRLRDDGLALVGEPTEVIRNDTPWEGKVVEAPCVVKHDSMYYLFYAGAFCCGEGCDYATGVARANRITGPWEKHPVNPLVSEDYSWRCVGHGSVVSDEAGDEWMVCHSYNRVATVLVGRQPIAARVRWTDGWPSLQLAPNRDPAGDQSIRYATDFRDAKLGPEWNWPLGPAPTLSAGEGLDLAPGEAGSTSMVALRPLVAPYRATATVVAPPPGSTAGLSLVGEQAKQVGVYWSGKRVRIVANADGEETEVAALEVGSAKSLDLSVELTTDGSALFAAKGSAAAARSFAPLDAKAFVPWDRTLRLGLSARGNGPVRFKRFEVVPLE